ncbi:MAG TPA: hypothetical protein VM735_09810 [Candidatus Kapabacteria bacterium]|nr:hypothetical protein [Candidatus Kapabacteria bacterium]
MRIERIIYSVLVVAASLTAVIQWRKAVLFAADNNELRSRIEAMEVEAESAGRLLELAKGASEKVRAQTTELMKLRNELTQSRESTKAVETLRAQNEQLKSELQRTRSGAAAATADQAAERATPASDVFPRDQWSFAGYASPESALVSAIWAMKEGNPETYLNSLTPEEQQRIDKVWQDKSENEILSKHRNDVSGISAFAIVERETLSPSEMVMSVAISSEGATRTEKIRMNQVGQDWKFGGFIRE